MCPRPLVPKSDLLRLPSSIMISGSSVLCKDRLGKLFCLIRFLLSTHTPNVYKVQKCLDGHVSTSAAMHGSPNGQLNRVLYSFSDPAMMLHIGSVAYFLNIDYRF